MESDKIRASKLSQVAKDTASKEEAALTDAKGGVTESKDESKEISDNETIE